MPSGYSCVLQRVFHGIPHAPVSAYTLLLLHHHLHHQHYEGIDPYTAITRARAFRGAFPGLGELYTIERGLNVRATCFYSYMSLNECCRRCALANIAATRR